jgi:NAD(P)-dependent dehydrogenase (short-subunit alcohol dehydrogenase family)
MNSVALVTGGSRGIGRGIALELAKLGWDVLVNFVSNETAARATATDCVTAAEEAGHTIRTDVFRADISLGPDRTGLVAFARERFGRIDMLVNNAGVAPEVRVDLLEASETSFDRVLGINLKGPFFLTQLVARWMVEMTLAGQGGASPKIVTISSISSYTASTNRGDYCLAKAALSMLTPLFAARLAEHGINVYEIRPGIIETDMTNAVKDKYDRLIKNGLTPIKRWGTPEDVGKAVAAIAQNLLPFSTGEVINVDGGFHVRRL